MQLLMTCELNHSDHFHVCVSIPLFYFNLKFNLGGKRLESRWGETSCGCVDQAIHVTATSV